MNYKVSSKKLFDTQYDGHKVKIGAANAAVDIPGNPKALHSIDNDNNSIKHEYSKTQLKEIFSEELSELINEEKVIGYKEGMAIAEKKHSEQKHNELDEIKRKHILIGKVSEELKEISEKSHSEQSEKLLETIFKVLSTLVIEPEFYSDFIKSTITNIVKEYREEPLRLLINPKDIKLLDEKEMKDFLSNTNIIEDSSITTGGIIIESEQNTIDARLENILTNTKNLLMNAYHE